MRAMVPHAIGAPLTPEERPTPQPGSGEIRHRVALTAGVRTTTTVYPLEKANEALADLRAGRFQGAAVLGP